MDFLVLGFFCVYCIFVTSYQGYYRTQKCSLKKNKNCISRLFLPCPNFQQEVEVGQQGGPYLLVWYKEVIASSSAISWRVPNIWVIWPTVPPSPPPYSPPCHPSILPPSSSPLPLLGRLWRHTSGEGGATREWLGAELRKHRSTSCVLLQPVAVFRKYFEKKIKDPKY